MQKFDHEDKDENIKHLIRRLHRYFFVHSCQGMSQGKVLGFLLNGPKSQKDIQDYMQVSAASVSELISKLEVKTLVCREKSENDRRLVNISLTEKGKKETEEFLNIDKDDTSIPLSDDEKDELLSLLWKMENHYMAQTQAQNEDAIK